MKWYEDKRNIKVAERLLAFALFILMCTIICMQSIENDRLYEENIQLNRDIAILEQTYGC